MSTSYLAIFDRERDVFGHVAWEPVDSRGTLYGQSWLEVTEKDAKAILPPKIPKRCTPRPPDSKDLIPLRVWLRIDARFDESRLLTEFWVERLHSFRLAWLPILGYFHNPKEAQEAAEQWVQRAQNQHVLWPK